MPGDCLSYFTGRGAALGPLWKDFKEQAPKLVYGEAAAAEAVSSARETFALLDE